jgi:hypothetical protein
VIHYFHFSRVGGSQMPPLLRLHKHDIRMKSSIAPIQAERHAEEQNIYGKSTMFG